MTLCFRDWPPILIEKDIRSLFAEHGEVGSISIDRKTRTALVEMPSDLAALRAVEHLDARVWHGHRLSVGPNVEEGEDL